jgi:hypothetical protein
VDDHRGMLDSNIEFQENDQLTVKKQFLDFFQNNFLFTLSINRPVVRGLLHSISCSLQRLSKNLFDAIRKERGKRVEYISIYLYLV